MKRKLLTILLIAAMTASLTACGGEENAVELGNQATEIREQTEKEEAGSTERQETEDDTAVENISGFDPEIQALIDSVTEETAVYHGSCGPDTEWYWKDNVLVIKGTGAITENPWQSPEYCEDNKNAFSKTRSREFGIDRVIIDEGIVAIEVYEGEGAFGFEPDLTEVILPSTLEIIGEGTFNNCTELSSITIPDSVTSIGIGAFFCCYALTEISIPEGITSIEAGTFNTCSSLTSITIPDSVTSIGIQAFEECSRLADITIPESVTTIGEYAFGRCYSLTDITIPESVTSIENGVFAECIMLASVTIPESVTTIGEYAFAQCHSLADITISDSVTFIGNKAFLYCDGLDDSAVEKIKSINPDAF